MKKCRAFTLIEIIFALSILSLILTVAYGSLSSITRAKKSLDNYQDVYIVAQAVLKRLTRELQLVSFDQQPGASGARGNGLLPLPNQPTTTTGPFFRYSRASDDAQPGLSFLAMEAGQYLPDGGSHSGLVQINYRLVPDPDDEKSQILVREELPYILPAEEAYKKRMTFPLANDIIDLQFEFYDRQADQWVEQWGLQPTTASKLPTLIRLSLTLRSKDGTEMHFATMVPVKSGTS